MFKSLAFDDLDCVPHIKRGTQVFAALRNPPICKIAIISGHDGGNDQLWIIANARQLCAAYVTTICEDTNTGDWFVGVANLGGRLPRRRSSKHLRAWY